jgi:hypothetical protein
LRVCIADANADAAQAWFENDPEGVAFEFEVIGAE